MIADAVTAILCLTCPLLVLALTRRSRVADAIGAVVLCYIPGIVLVNAFPSIASEQVAKTMTDATIPLAIPMLLLSARFVDWLRHGRAAALSFSLACAATVGATLAVVPLFVSRVPEAATLGGMLVGTYTGGTPNMAAVGKSLGASDELFVLLNGADTVVCGIYLLALMSVVKPILARVFPAWPGGGWVEEDEREPPTRRERAVGAGIGLVIAAVALALGVGASLVIVGEIHVALVMLGLTLVGVGASLYPKVRELRGPNELGEYLVLVFCASIGVRTDVATLLSTGVDVLLMTAIIVVLGLVFHAILARIAGIDVDTFIVTSTAAVFGPPFVGPVCEAIGNRDVMLSGMTTGLVGYAVGNFLGVAVATALS